MLYSIRLRILSGAGSDPISRRRTIHHLIVDGVLLHQKIVNEALLFGELRLEHVHLGLQLDILVLEEVARHLVPQDVIVQALTLLSNILRTHLRDLQIHCTWVLGREPSAISTLHTFVEGSETSSQIVSESTACGWSLFERHRTLDLLRNHLIINVLWLLSDVALMLQKHWCRHLLVAILHFIGLGRLSPDPWRGIGCTRHSIVLV